MDTYTPTERSRARRLHERARYDHASVNAVLDSSFVCHVGYTIGGQPYVTPTSYWREEDRLYWHGSSASRMLRTLSGSVPACLTVTHVDGLVVARSGFHHSMNYRCVMAFGLAQKIEDREEKSAALQVFVDRIFPGRWDRLRPMTDQEFKATTVLKMRIEEASAKTRSGWPIDDEEDYALPIWAGLVKFRSVVDGIVPDARLSAGIAPSPDLAAWEAGGAVDQIASDLAATYAPAPEMAK
jgi:nitroimidazol reductase NimA-like FMN-containing flavoprotein (pyridoxamine 5'-phosphate oxidase superfamily)